jgi:hypothetical protein
MQLPVKNPNIVFRRVSEGAVLLSTEDEVYFGLNEVGAEIWDLLTPEVETFDDLRDALARKYPDVDVGQIGADLKEILDELLKAGMLKNNEKPLPAS